jgi:ABC-2 type transport system permease protein
MRFLELATRNLKETFRDPLSIGLTIVLPIGLFLILQTLGNLEEIFRPTVLAPGIALFGFVMIVFSSGFLLARDRESALLTRMLTAPLRASDFIAAYALPFIPVGIIQVAGIFGIGSFLGLRISGSVGLVFLILFIMCCGYIGVGMIMGSLVSSKQVGFAYMIVLFPTIFSGAWVPVDLMGDGFRRVVNLLPFAHALDATRAVMVDGARFADIATDFLWVVAYSAVFLALGVLAFRRRMVE